MSWASLLHNSEGIVAIYQGAPPDLAGVHVHEVVLHEDGPNLSLRLDLPRYPDSPPRKWVAKGFNTVQVEISLGGIKTVTLNGFGTHVTADIELSKRETVTLDVVSPETHISATADVVFISKLTAYSNQS
ncbi:Imm50 family immunity protein [Streptomyces sp. NPDC006184]|uniref:Imm50 family immunity protein n=1 Tax=Streptomyces sp. NPDC006184 TaxID=3155455 RepID=UPI0033AA7704